ncbi:hypothetical protein PGT21_000097 [Puccinia graminis f. sp. tritici]|uniref:Uncharacterized protein n=1 Tax=Puccinia graminis f. sp. tritici TaxID=56615 RepID=A0A5B0MZH9_PUCGR|nr:hypothetical protein PGT21_000097 [Puccinia graminis f. sp. tritici]
MASPKPTRTKPQTRNSVLKLSLLSLLSTTTPIINNGVRASADAHRRDDISFRGPVPEDLHVPHWDFSGSAHRIPAAKDFVRLITPFPLAYGAMFTEQPIPFDQWSVEIAFRIHGGFSDLHHGHHNETHPSDDDEEITGKGGRGIAFWYTKTPNSTPLVASTNPKKHVVPRPPLTVDQFPDPLDDAVSFFGGPTSFNGLSVVIDNQPSTPLTRRSDRQHWGPEESGIGAEEWSVVSGVIDDGRGHIKWLEDRKRSDLEEDEEAAYLNHTVGDCQVALRNAAGVVWMKVTYVGHQLTPSDEADNVDIYAIEVKEIKGKAKSEEEVIEHYKKNTLLLMMSSWEGTGKARDPTNLAFEALNSQRDWAQTIKQMSLKLDNLGSRPSQINNANGQTTEPVSSGNNGVDSQLQAINAKLDNILHKLDTAAPVDLEAQRFVNLIFYLHERFFYLSFLRTQSTNFI